jgi:hypothetical protein
MVLLALWLFGLGSSGARAFAWLDLLLGLGFIALTGAALAESAAWPRRRSVRPPHEVYRT